MRRWQDLPLSPGLSGGADRQGDRGRLNLEHLRVKKALTLSAHCVMA
jgi:hypothetical protein